MKYDLTTFGETMVRLSTRPGDGLETATRADLTTGGSESNTAGALARLGMKTAWVSRLPDNPLGKRIAADVGQGGADTSGIIWTKDDRAGIYFVEFNAAPRPSAVTYDRRHSAIAKIKPQEIPWQLLLDTRVLHLTGITPALSPACRRAVAQARDWARSKNIPVSFDLNYRSKLWAPAAAAKALAPLAAGVALLVMTREDAQTVFKFSGDPEETVRGLHREFQPGVVALTGGGDGAWCWDGKKLRHEPGYAGVEAVDRLGAGDAFTAGLIFGFLRRDLGLGLQYGLAMSALKLGMRGDRFLAGPDEVRQVIEYRGGDVRR